MIIIDDEMITASSKDLQMSIMTNNINMENNPNSLQIIKDDPYLAPYSHTFRDLHQKMTHRIDSFAPEGGLNAISNSYHKYGLHSTGRGQNGEYLYFYQEWAPNAAGLSVFGDFNNWDRGQHQAKKDEYGHWKCQLVLKDPIKEFSKIKCQVRLENGETFDRIPAWINYCIQDPVTKGFDGAFIQLGKYSFEHPRPSWSSSDQALKIYECHIGMSGVSPQIHSYKHFQQIVLPKIDELGYNTIQIMAILQHPYYGSFGYHVTNFYAISSRFGTPDEFKSLVDEAHRRGIKVIIDLVHAHAAKNIHEGINYWDGTDYQYFYSGAEGVHEQWDSRIFDYSKYQVLRFLLSNIRFWLEEYNTDGFRFDGVTSILYRHHGVNFQFTGHYDEYFNQRNLNSDAVVYLMIANLLAKHIYSDVILIAEDVSGFPALCRTHEDGGIGFNYRLSMAVPDMWIKLLKEVRDEDWDIHLIVHQLTNRRWKEKCICYSESHDQSLVGDKTISMWLFDSQIYTHMSVLNEETPVIFRGMALHKMIRLVTLSLGGEGYLNFIGNQFGHPQWVDFPRQGNNWSYHYCRRRWDLSEDLNLKYKFLLAFDKAMLKLDHDHKIINSPYQYIREKQNTRKTLIYEKGNILFVFNWHPTVCYEGYDIYAKKCSSIQVLWSTDDTDFGGQGRALHRDYEMERVDDFCSRTKIYLPNRCAIVFKIVEQ